MLTGETVTRFGEEICDWKLTAEIFEYLPACPNIGLITRSVNCGRGLLVNLNRPLKTNGHLSGCS
jgi:hypothetical protein